MSIGYVRTYPSAREPGHTRFFIFSHNYLMNILLKIFLLSFMSLLFCLFYYFFINFLYHFSLSNCLIFFLYFIFLIPFLSLCSISFLKSVLWPQIWMKFCQIDFPYQLWKIRKRSSLQKFKI